MTTCTVTIITIFEQRTSNYFINMCIPSRQLFGTFLGFQLWSGAQIRCFKLVQGFIFPRFHICTLIFDVVFYWLAILLFNPISCWVIFFWVLFWVFRSITSFNYFFVKVVRIGILLGKTQKLSKKVIDIHVSHLFIASTFTSQET